MVFRIFKKPIAAITVVNDVVAMLQQMEASISQCAADIKIATNAQRATECQSFAYIIGWYAIQNSNLSATEKHKFSAELTGAVTRKIAAGDLGACLSVQQMLHDRLGAYNYAMNYGKGADWASKLVVRFLQYLNADSPDNVGILASLCYLTPTYVSAIKEFLGGINENYKFM